MMSGTSYDAIDAAAAELRFEGDELVLQPLGMLSRPYSAGLRAALAAALPPANTSLAAVTSLDTGVGQAFAEVAAQDRPRQPIGRLRVAGDAIGSVILLRAVPPLPPDFAAVEIALGGLSVPAGGNGNGFCRGHYRAAVRAGER